LVTVKQIKSTLKCVPHTFNMLTMQGGLYSIPYSPSYLWVCAPRIITVDGLLKGNLQLYLTFWEDVT
jgi:hypothetical protein